MAFFDEFSQRAKYIANAASEKTKDAVDSARLTAAIVSEQRELDKNYRAIGEWFVSTWEGEIPAGVADLMDAVRTSRDRIAELKAKRKILGEEPGGAEKTCPLCGAATEGRFCPHCGAPIQRD